MIRPRRNRKTPAIRGLVQEFHLPNSKLVFPLFMVDGKNIKSEIPSLPNLYRYSTDLLIKEIESCVK
jgi:porphobilinogen synthase